MDNLFESGLSGGLRAVCAHAPGWVGKLLRILWRDRGFVGAIRPVV